MGSGKIILFHTTLSFLCCNILYVFSAYYLSQQRERILCILPAMSCLLGNMEDYFAGHWKNIHNYGFHTS